MEEGRIAIYANAYNVHIIYLIKMNYAIFDIGIPDYMTIVICNVIDCRKRFHIRLYSYFSASIFPDVI